MIDANSKLLIHAVTKYLHEEFEPESLGDFHDADALKLFTQLKELMPVPSIVKRLHLVHDTFIKFFGDLGDIKVQVNSIDDIKIKTKIDPKTLKAMRLLEDYAEHLDDSQGPHLLIIDEKTTQKLREDLNCSDDESFRNIIRKVFPFVFDLGEKYAILFGKSRITIRVHMDAPAQEQRYNGLPPEDLDALVLGMFPDLNEELPPLMRRSFTELFDFGTLSNAEFEDRHIIIMQKELLKIVKMRSDQDDEINKGITNFILRKHFEIYHQLLAEQLISSIMNKKANTDLFLSYYTQKSINIKGIKYKVPQLIDPHGTVWSLPNINNIASQRRNDLNELAKKNEFIGKMEKVLDTIDDEIAKEEREVQEAKQAFQESVNELREVGEELSKYRAALKQLRSNTNYDVDKEAQISAYITKLSGKELKLMKVRDEADRNVTKQENDVKAKLSKKQSNTIRLNSEIDKIEEIEKRMDDVKQRYELMIAAVGAVLSKKKEKIN